MLKLLCLIFNTGMLIWVVAWVIGTHQWPLPLTTFIVLLGSALSLYYIARSQGFGSDHLLGAWLERLTLEEKNKIKKLREKLDVRK